MLSTIERRGLPVSRGFSDPALLSEPNARLSGINFYLTWFIVPLLGITLPNITGLMKPELHVLPGLFFHYAFFIAVAEVIYKGNLYFLYRLRLQSLEITMPYIKVVTLYFMVNIVYSGIISLAGLSTWHLYAANEKPFAQPVIFTTLVILVCVLFINNMYEILYLRTEKKNSLRKMQVLEEARLQAEMQALHSHLDPHFLYNALTSLSYLIQKKPWEADNHNSKLAALYRYILQTKATPLVTLEQELDFCRDYFAIQQVRFGDAVLLQIVSGDEQLERLQVPPLSIQILLENAIKHNRFSYKEPLLIQVHVSASAVIVTNTFNKRTSKEKSMGSGLKNLNQRLLLLINKPLKIERTKGCFNVTLPTIARHNPVL